LQELEKYIKSYFDLDSSGIKILSSFFTIEHVAKNEFHTKFGARNAALSFVRSGHLRVYRQDAKKEVTQWIASPREFVTDLSAVMFNQPARWNIQALTDCELFTISKSDYDQLKYRIPEWNDLEKLFLAKCFLILEDRVFSFISMTAEERYHYFQEIRSDLFTDTPQQFLASMLGITPETFSRIRKKSVS